MSKSVARFAHCGSSAAYRNPGSPKASGSPADQGCAAVDTRLHGDQLAHDEVCAGGACGESAESGEELADVLAAQPNALPVRSVTRSEKTLEKIDDWRSAILFREIVGVNEFIAEPGIFSGIERID